MAIAIKKNGGGSADRAQNNTGGQKVGAAGQGGGSGSGVSEVGQTFSTFFNAADRKMSVEEIKRMINELDRDAADIEKNPTFSGFEKYREKIKKILAEICSRLYKVDKAERVTPKGKKVENIIVNRVEGIMTELEAEFNKKAKIDFLKMHYEIRGLLLDMTS